MLPWQERGAQLEAAEVYLRYLDDRPDSVVAALRLIAGTDGATIVHCAAGKDRTGVVVALALAEVGVTREAIVDDYARTAERIEGILSRLRASPTYGGDIGTDTATTDKHTPSPETMERLLNAVDELHGGVRTWLRANGWTDSDAKALRSKLLD